VFESGRLLSGFSQIHAMGIYRLNLVILLVFLQPMGWAGGHQESEEMSAAIEVPVRWNLFSVEQDIQLGSQSAGRFENTLQRVDDAKLNDFFDRLGNKLVSTLQQQPFPFEFTLIADSFPYAFSLPGGQVYCTSGLFAATRSEDQLAGVLAHQIAHVVLRDTTRQASLQARFRVRASMVAASTEKKTLLEALEEIGFFLMPGSEAMNYGNESEYAASALVTLMLQAAGYSALDANGLFVNQEEGVDQSLRVYSERHASMKIQPLNESSAGTEAPSDDLASTRKFKRLKKRAAAISNEGQLEVMLQMQPPADEMVASVNRELFVSDVYSLSYPAIWIPYESGQGNELWATPKGGVVPLESGRKIVTAGVIAGMTPPSESTDSLKNTLLKQAEQHRPDLSKIETSEGEEPSGKGMKIISFRSESTVSGKVDTVKAAGARFGDRVFYLLMIAPENDPEGIQNEFDTILASVEFKEKPLMN